ncbi:hypothetical protein HZB05_02330 [Candidatus Wolfebacteria bacterium]|nr:hypothetical protein [Candidatus Wolfebacteria bacterium]
MGYENNFFSKKKNKKFEEIIEQKERLNIADPEEAREFIKNQLEKGELPVVTIPQKFIEYLKNGLRAYTDWTGHKILAATLGREYYSPKGEERVAVKIKGLTIDQIYLVSLAPIRRIMALLLLKGLFLMNN